MPRLYRLQEHDHTEFYKVVEVYYHETNESVSFYLKTRNDYERFLEKGVPRPEIVKMCK
jgi:hypothetical protein